MLYKKSPQAWAHVHNILDITVDKGWSDQGIHSCMRTEINGYTTEYYSVL